MKTMMMMMTSVCVSICVCVCMSVAKKERKKERKKSDFSSFSTKKVSIEVCGLFSNQHPPLPNCKLVNKEGNKGGKGELRLILIR